MMQNWVPIAVVFGGYVAGVYFQNRSNAHLERRIEDSQKNLLTRIEDSQKYLEGRIDESQKYLENRIDDSQKIMQTRIDDLSKRIDDTRDILRAEMRANKAELLMEIEKQANRRVLS